MLHVITRQLFVEYRLCTFLSFVGRYLICLFCAILPKLLKVVEKHPIQEETVKSFCHITRIKLHFCYFCTYKPPPMENEHHFQGQGPSTRLVKLSPTVCLLIHCSCFCNNAAVSRKQFGRFSLYLRKTNSTKPDSSNSRMTSTEWY